MTLNELFAIITKIIADPHTQILDHDKQRAAQIFLAFDDFLIDHVENYCSDDTMFDLCEYASQVIDELENKK